VNCRTCAYPLWNLPARTCPECGTPFIPSEFDFVKNSVRFMCPHCSQPYYGTGEHGHLVPREFDCVSCRARVSMDEMVLLPTEGVAENRTIPDRLPWAERTSRGFVRAWLSTVWMTLTRPTRLMRAARDTPAGSAWSFAIFTLSAVVLAGAVPFIAFAMLAPGPGIFGFAFVAGAFLFLAGGTILAIAVWGLLAHAALKITGPTRGTIGRTYVALGFASGATVVAAIPCLGFYIAILVVPIWWGIVAILMLAESQRVAIWRAAIAGLIAPVLFYAALAALFLGTFSAVSTSMTAARTAAATVQPTTMVQSTTTALVRYASAHNGRGPTHAAELLAAGSLTSANLIATNVTGSKASDVPIARKSLEDFFLMGPDERTAEAQAATTSMPGGVIAHRLGDLVFTHHGIDLSNPDPRLWIVIFSPNPASARTLSGNIVGTSLPVGTADGRVTQVFLPQYARLLAEQNEVRAELGLAPLADPLTVTHERPSVVPQGPP
jgi:Yip1 domain